MKSPAVIYALKIQKESIPSASHIFESDDGKQIQSIQESSKSPVHHQMGIRFLIMAFFILISLMTGAILIFA